MSELTTEEKSERFLERPETIVVRYVCPKYKPVHCHIKAQRKPHPSAIPSDQVQDRKNNQNQGRQLFFPAGDGRNIA